MHISSSGLSSGFAVELDDEYSPIPGFRG